VAFLRNVPQRTWGSSEVTPVQPSELVPHGPEGHRRSQDRRNPPEPLVRFGEPFYTMRPHPHIFPHGDRRSLNASNSNLEDKDLNIGPVDVVVKRALLSVMAGHLHILHSPNFSIHQKPKQSDSYLF
jgi:hypothetical protein